MIKPRCFYPAFSFLIMIIMTVVCAIHIGCHTVEAEIIFTDNFDGQSNWSPGQPSGLSIECWGPCGSVLSGYQGYRVMATIFPDNNPRHATMSIDASNPRGGTGKSLNYWSESAGGMTVWASDGLLVKDLGRDYDEIFVRFWIKFQPGWQWVRNENPMQKFFRIAHYLGSGLPWQYGRDGNTMPQMIFDLAKYRGGNSDIAATISPRCAPNYDCSPDTTDIYYYPAMNGKRAGNYGGGGTDFGDPGMIGDGKWHSWEFYLKRNSAVGVADGSYKFWQDGTLIGQANKIAWSDRGSPRSYGWNQVIFGGNNNNGYKRAADGAEQWYSIDDIVISTHYSGPPPKPVRVSAKLENGTTARVSWAAGTNEAHYLLDGYRIYYGTDPNNLNSAVTAGKSLSWAIKNLHAGKTYYFAVVSFNKAPYDSNDNASQLSDTVTVTTTGD